jgi:hypothetical protein
VSTPAAPNNVFTDNWAQADGSPWSPSWTPSAGSGSVDVQGGRGALSFQDLTGAYARAVLSGVPSKASSEALLSYQLSSTSAVSYVSVFLRGSGGWANSYRPLNGYGLQITSNSGAVAVQRNVSGNLSTLITVSGAQQVSTAKHWLRFRVEGSQIMFRTWIDGSSEPAAWAYSGTDSGLTTAGQMYVSHVRGGSNVGARTMFIDDLSLTSIG